MASRSSRRRCGRWRLVSSSSGYQRCSNPIPILILALILVHVCVPCPHAHLVRLDDMLYQYLVSAEAKAEFEDKASPRRQLTSPLKSNAGRVLVMRWGWVCCLVDVVCPTALYVVTATSTATVFLDEKARITLIYFFTRCGALMLAQLHITRRCGGGDSMPLPSYALRAAVFVVLTFGVAAAVFTLAAAVIDYDLGANQALLNNPKVQACSGTLASLGGIANSSVIVPIPFGSGVGGSCTPSQPGQPSSCVMTSIPCTQFQHVDGIMDFLAKTHPMRSASSAIQTAWLQVSPSLGLTDPAHTTRQGAGVGAG
jgi:hypothetical protein